MLHIALRHVDFTDRQSCPNSQATNRPARLPRVPSRQRRPLELATPQQSSPSTRRRSSSESRLGPKLLTEICNRVVTCATTVADVDRSEENHCTNVNLD